MLKLEDKDPGSVVDYNISFEQLLQAGETISSHTVTMTDSGLTKDSDSASTDTVSIFFSGGTEWETYRFTIKIVTNQSRTFNRVFCLSVLAQPD